ncbi:MAG: DEAD/DEAH box helicase [Myxococcaceae bacterium]
MSLPEQLASVRAHLEELELLDVPLFEVILALKDDRVRSGTLNRLAKIPGPVTLRQFFNNRILFGKFNPSELEVLLLHWSELASDQPITFLELGELAEALPDARRPLAEVLREVTLEAGIRRELENLAQRRKLSVLAFFDEADDNDHWTDSEYRRTVAAFRAWLDARPSSNVIPLHPSTDVPQLDERLKALAIPDLDQWTLGQLGRCSRAAESLTVQQALEKLHPELVRLLPAFETMVKRARAMPTPTEGAVSQRQLMRLRDVALSERLKLTQLPIGLGDCLVGSRVFNSRRYAFQVQPLGGVRAFLVELGDPLHWVDSPGLTCQCKRTGCSHVAAVLELLAFALPANPDLAARLDELLTPRWQHLLEVLERPADPRRTPNAVISFTLDHGLIEARVHTVGKTGVRSKQGKHLSRKGLDLVAPGPARELGEALLAGQWGGRASNPFVGSTLTRLVGLPNVRWVGDLEDAPVELVSARLTVAETAQGFELAVFAGTQRLTLGPTWATPAGSLQLVRGEKRILLVEHTSATHRVLEAVELYGATLPREALQRLTDTLPELEKTAPIELPESLRGTEVPPVTKLVARVSRSSSGLGLLLLVEPIPGGALLPPGEGAPLAATFDGRQRSFTRRDFTAEQLVAAEAAQSLGLTLPTKSWTWALEPSQPSLEILERLQRAPFEVEWATPKPTFTREAQLSELELSVNRQKDWFGLEGFVEVDDRRVMLATLLEAARHRRRFVQLGEQDYATLSDSLLERLVPLSMLGKEGKPVELTVAALPLVASLEGEVKSLEAAKEWRELMKRLSSAAATTFPVPASLKTPLREYQREGYEWMCRLSQWCSGAVLADDMGLGKTVQALALLLQRAALGPALVVAPSSVLHTWRTEAARHAPSLVVRLFEETDRELDSLEPGSVTVVSWTMFAKESARFARRRFATVVFDEAHAMKNASTLRAKAAHDVQAEFSLALSGTPIENHVGELWSLFRAVMPLLLGSQESFDSRFGRGTKETTRHLATLIRPFILRRTKDAVATELPPRTDIELVVPLSEEERALYVDVRLSAIAELGDVSAENRRFEVLAALTRLRLAACHPKLIDGRWKGTTSKLDRLLELLEQLREERHRVLVFSQFTQHLALVKKALEGARVKYSYLDGAVPVVERQRRVEAFQAGTGGDVFLISLKAGGTGLTLTAADYVVHLDPWWNPAVEDQASDRAHRIGQTKPVTVYRLIAEGTVEQQILSLHRDKRELADALLEGADLAGKLGAKELAALIQAGAAP